MLRLLVVVSVISCGPPRPSVTVPAPVVVATAPDEALAATLDGLAPPQPTLRLPRNFLPTGYTGRLVIDPQQNGFTGTLAIAGTISERSSVIWLHGKGLKVTRAVAEQGATHVELKVTQKGEDLLEIIPKQPLASGAWTLAFDYAGAFELRSTTGIFKQTVAGNDYVYTQLEAVYARRMFPCFDEPDSKVPWKLTLDVPKALVAVTNTPQTSETSLGATLKRVEFATSKPMPSYLVALGVGPFELVDAGKTRNGTPIRIVTLAKRSAEAAWAVKTAPKILAHLEDWFGSPYPYEKLDFLTIPLTVGFGAMENAGLITFTETLMLIDPVKASKQRQHRWVSVAAHELAHQWFGDLVTMMYWDDIWLNEGFANWMESKVTTFIDPTYRDDESTLDTRNAALDADALVHARQIRQPIETPDDILNVFDRITYDKGASVLAMFEGYLGPPVFQQGVRSYLAAKAWGNATSNDFAAAISSAAGTRVEQAFSSFLDQAGAPEITATLDCKGPKAKLMLAQQRYVPPGSPTPPAGAPWIVPICVAFEKAGGRAEACTLLSTATGSLELPTKCPRWVMPNVNGRGYYRNAYTTAQVTALRDEAWSKLAWNERRALAFDVAAAVATGRLPLPLGLSFGPKLLVGNDRFTVPPAIDLPTRYSDFVPDELRGKYEHSLRATFGPGALNVGLVPKPSDTIDHESTRSELIWTVGWLGREPRLVAEAVGLADKWRDLPQSIRELVLVIAVDATPALFERILKEAPLEPDRARRQEMYAALARVRDVTRQQAALRLIIDAKIDIRETIHMLEDASTPANRAVAATFFRDHQVAIMGRMPQDETSTPLAGLASLFTNSCKADERAVVTEYVTRTFAKLPGGARLVKQKLEGMDQCIAKRARLEPEIRAWLGGIRIPKPKPQGS